MDFLDVQKLADANHNASRLASSRVAELWESLDGLDDDTLRDVLDELFPRLVEEQAQLAASATRLRVSRKPTPRKCPAS